MILLVITGSIIAIAGVLFVKCALISIVGIIFSLFVTLYSIYKSHSSIAKIEYENQTLDEAFNVERSEDGKIKNGPIVDGGTF